MARCIELERLGDPQSVLRAFSRPEEGAFVAESPAVIEYALDAGYAPVSVLVERTTLGGRARAILGRCGDIPIYTADREALRGLTGYAFTRGMLCAFRRPKPYSVEDVCEGARRLAVVDGLADPANVGAIFRSAAALGMDGVLLTDTCADPLYRKAVRVSMGAVFRVKWTGMDASGWRRLRESGFVLAAMALREPSLPPDSPLLTGADKLCVVLGSEGTGLSDETLDRCDHIVRIPMSNGIDSLNVAAAAAVAFWQLRPRDGGG